MLSRILERLLDHAARAPETVAVREIVAPAEIGRTLTYRALAERVGSFAHQLRTSLPSGSVVMLCCPNVCEFYVAFLGALAANLIVFPVSQEIAEAELITAAKCSKANAAIGTDRAICSLSGHIVTRIDLESVMSAPLAILSLTDTPAAGLYLQSSGTTGRPKIVHRSAESLDAVASNMCDAIGFAPTDRVLATVPLCHSYGLEHGLLGPIFAGSAVHLARGFELHAVLRELATQSITVFPGVPSMFEMIAILADGAVRFPAMRVAYSAGGALPRSVFDAIEQKFSLRVGQLYGATEIGSVTFADPASPTFDPASVGLPMNGVRIRIDSAGQVLIAASSMLARYVGDDEPLDLIDGHFPTADLGHVDSHSNLAITGRIKLLIDVGGLKVNPFEVEDVLSRHPDVAACVVVPMRLSETVFRVKAIVTPHDPDHPPDAEALRLFAREHLTTHKVPRVVEVRASLPRSPTGKILRHLVEAT